MYTHYWHLQEAPFENLADPRFAYLSDQHREGLARLLYIARGQKQGGVLTGPYGVGKSMILEMVGNGLNARESNASRFVHFDAPPGGTPAFVSRVMHAMDDESAVDDIAQALDRLNVTAGPHTVLAVDEAQLIEDPGIYRFLHLITNLRRHSDRGMKPAFTLLLAGHQDTLKGIAQEPALRQRLSLVWNLDPLNEQQTGEYVRRRLEVAGGKDVMFDDDAIREVYRASGGLPRMINNICDITLMIGCAANASRIDRQMVTQAIEDSIASTDIR